MIQKISYDKFELKIPRCFRIERQTLLKQMDNDIDEMNTQINNTLDMTEDMLEEEKNVEHNLLTANQTDSEGSSLSDVDVITLMRNDQKIPEKFQEITREEIQRQMAIKLIQKHIRAMRDRIFVNERMCIQSC